MGLKEKLQKQLNNPIPSDLESECAKATRILNDFVKPSSNGPDSLILQENFIPPDILEKAKGLAILTVIRGGFMFSARGGSGIVVARMADGWSAPSSIGMASVGTGALIGADITDYVFVLNTDDAVKAFSVGGNVTLGGNVGVAAGPYGRSAEASAALAHFAPVFSYSKSKGLYAGVSVEGSVIVERKDTNERFYGRKVSAKELLSGSVPPPLQASALYDALQRRASPGSLQTPASSTVPSSQSNAANSLYYAHPTVSQEESLPKYTPSSSYVAPGIDSKRAPFMNATSSTSASASTLYGSSSYSSINRGEPTLPPRRAPPPPPPPRKLPTVTALYDFQGTNEGDLSFRQGERIVVLKRTDSKEDWWFGRLGKQEGYFPSNYVEDS